MRAANIDDSCVLKFVIKEPQDAIARVVVQRVQSFVDHHQTRFLQQDTREDQTLLFLIAEFLMPAGDFGLVMKKDDPGPLSGAQQ